MPKLLCSADAPEWLELRRSGITASDLPVIMGLVSWDSPWALYHRKRGTLPETEQTDRMRLGSWLENSIMGEWGRRHDDTAYELWPALWQNDERSWQMATPDAVVLDSEPVSTAAEAMAGTWPVAVLECKTSATRDGWGEDRTDQVPAYVRAQVLWQMDTLNVSTGHVAVVFLPSGEFRSYTIDHTERETGHRGFCDIYADQVAMRKAALEFYRRITGELPPPPVDHLTVTTKALQEVYAGMDDTLQAELGQELVDAYETAKAIAKSADADLTLYKNMIREALGTASVGAVNGTPVIRRQIVKRAGYEVAPGIQDKLISIKPREDT